MFLRDITNIHDSPICHVCSDSPSFVVHLFPIPVRAILWTRENPLTHGVPGRGQIHLVSQFFPEHMAPSRQPVVLPRCV